MLSQSSLLLLSATTTASASASSSAVVRSSVPTVVLRTSTTLRTLPSPHHNSIVPGGGGYSFHGGAGCGGRFISAGNNNASRGPTAQRLRGGALSPPAAATHFRRRYLPPPPSPSTIQNSTTTTPRLRSGGIALTGGGTTSDAPTAAGANGMGIGIGRIGGVVGLGGGGTVGIGIGIRGGIGIGIIGVRRNYVVLPSKLSELSRFVWDGIKYYTGFYAESVGRRTSRRLVLRLRDKTEGTTDSSGVGVGVGAGGGGAAAATKLGIRRVRLRSRLRDHRARVGQHLRNATNRWRSRVVAATERSAGAVAVARAASSGGKRLSSRIRGTGRIAVLRATRMVHRARRRAARARDRLSVSSSSSTSPSPSPSSPRGIGGMLLLASASASSSSTPDESESSSSPPSSWRWRNYAIDLPDASSSSRFDSDGYPLASRDHVTGRFINPWCDSACRHRPLSDLFRWRIEHRWFEARDLVPSSASEFWRRTGVFFAGRSGGGRGRQWGAAAARTADAAATATTTTERVRAAVEAYERQRVVSSKGTAAAAAAAAPDPSGRASAHLLSSSSADEEIDDPPPSTAAPRRGDGGGVGIDGDDERVKLTWIGHSTCLVQMDGFAVLTDPVFSHRIGPLAPLVGVDRFVPPSHTVDEVGSDLLGRGDTTGGTGGGGVGGVIDAVLISHDHYDHLDYASIHELVTSEHVHVSRWFVPLGTKRWLLDRFGNSEPYSYGPHIDEDDVREMAWWDSAEFVRARRSDSEPASDGDRTKGMKMTVHCAPAQHWCSRTPFDRNSRLWCSWAVRTGPPAAPHGGGATGDDADGEAPPRGMEGGGDGRGGGLSFYYAGDTGLPPTPSSPADDYSAPTPSSASTAPPPHPPATATNAPFPLHRQIGDRLGPFDLSALPIGAYRPSFYMSDSHMDPEEARRVHSMLRSRKSVAVHWGTFPLADEPFYEPPARLRGAEGDGGGGLDGGGMFEGVAGASDVGDDVVQDGSFVVIRQGDSIESDRRHNTTAAAAGTMDNTARVNVAEGESIRVASSSRGGTMGGVGVTSLSEEGVAPNSSSSSPVRIIRKKKKKKRFVS